MVENNKVIIGIDFGTSGISFAYGFKSDANKNVIQGHFEGQIQNLKIPAEIILDNSLKEVKAFGSQCDNYISQNESNTYHHFKQIKMNLYKKNYKIKSNNQQKEVDIDYIITLMLIEVKKQSIKEIKKTKPSIKETDCMFVISVPAIWNYKSKEIMLQASQKAKLFEENDDTSSFFSLEPEAASIYYNTVINNYQDVIDSGNGFILCDLGSGTADIIAQKKVVNKENNQIHFEELYHPIGGDYGSQKINEYFIERVIKKLFGEETMKNLEKNIKNDYSEWIKFEKEVESFKKSYDFTLIENDIKYYSINCEIFQDFCNGNIDDLIDKYNENCPNNWKLNKKRRWIIDFPFNIMNDLMEEILKGIVDCIEEIRKNVQVKSLIFTGGGSLNPIIISKIQNKINTDLNFILSHNPETSISMGSVKYAFDRNIISIRKAKFSFGIGMSFEWNEELHKEKGKKVFDTITQKYYCDNLFSKFITKGEDIPSNKVIQKVYLMDSPIVIIDLYKTEKENVTFCDEKENEKSIVWKFGQFILEVDKGFNTFENSVCVDMKMGGTFISISAKYVKTNKKVSAIFVFED